MDQTTLDFIFLGLAGLLILSNAFFVAAEFALVSVRKTRIDELVAQGNTGARTVQKLMRDQTRFIAATQLGVTIAALALGWIGEPAFGHLIDSALSRLPANWISPMTAATIVSITAFVLITFLDVVVGELTPKSVALAYPDRVALIVAAPMNVLVILFRPVIWLLQVASGAILRLFKLKPPTGEQMVHSAEELKMLVSASSASGELEPVEREFANRALDFADRQAGEVMIPRTALRAVEDTATYQDFLTLFAEVSHSRFPIYHETLDNITGFVWIKDVLRMMAKDENARQLPIKEIARLPMFVPSTKEIGALFGEMQKQKAQMAIVLDEYGGTAGMLTIEELIEEVVGRVSDELAGIAPQIRRIADGQVEADAMLRVDEANALLGIRLPESDDYDTLAGLLMAVLGRVPHQGEVARVGNLKLTVTEMQGPKIQKLLITKEKR